MDTVQFIGILSITSKIEKIEYISEMFDYLKEHKNKTYVF